MSGGVTGYIEHVQRQIEEGHCDAVAFSQGLRTCRNALGCRAVYGNFSAQLQRLQKILNAADVIAVMVRANDGNKLQIIETQIIENRCRIARINHCRVFTVVDDPKIIILKRGYRMDNDCGMSGHAESVKIKK